MDGGISENFDFCDCCSVLPNWWRAGRSLGVRFAQCYKNGIAVESISATDPHSYVGFYQEVILRSYYDEALGGGGTATNTTELRYYTVGANIIDHPPEVLNDFTDGRNPGATSSVFDHSEIDASGPISTGDLYAGLRAAIAVAPWTASEASAGEGLLPSGSGYVELSGEPASAWGRQITFAPTIFPDELNPAQNLPVYPMVAVSPKIGMKLSCWVGLNAYDVVTETTSTTQQSFNLVFDGYQFAKANENLLLLPFGEILPFDPNTFWTIDGSQQEFELSLMQG